MILIINGLLAPGEARTRNFQIRSLARYPIASQGQIVLALRYNNLIPPSGLEPLATRLKV